MELSYQILYTHLILPFLFKKHFGQVSVWLKCTTCEWCIEKNQLFGIIYAECEPEYNLNCNQYKPNALEIVNLFIRNLLRLIIFALTAGSMT